MSTVMTECTNEPGILALQWNWRLAQQAFAAVVDRGVPASPMLIELAGRSLSALSGDERPAFERWLALQLVNADEMGVARRLRSLRKIDLLLAAGVRRQLSRVAAELLRSGDIAVAA